MFISPIKQLHAPCNMMPDIDVANLLLIDILLHSYCTCPSKLKTVWQCMALNQPTIKNMQSQELLSVSLQIGTVSKVKKKKTRAVVNRVWQRL